MASTCKKALHLLASGPLVSLRDIVPCKCTEDGISFARWRGDKEDKKLRTKEGGEREGDFQKQRFLRIYGRKKVSEGIFSSSRHLQMKASAVESALALGSMPLPCITVIWLGIPTALLPFTFGIAATHPITFN